jgi:hypothetical protein
MVKLSLALKLVIQHYALKTRSEVEVQSLHSSPSHENVL